MTGRWGEAPWRIGEVGSAKPPAARVPVAVVGAGLGGLSTALHLARRGIRAAIFEAGRIGSGASGRTGALVLEGTAAGDLPGADSCLEGLERLVGELGVDAALDLCGCLELEHRPATAGGEPGWTDGEGILVESGRVPGGTVDAGALVEGLAHAVLETGATIHERVSVRTVEADAHGARLRFHDDAGPVEAEHVVLALNAYAPRLVSIEETFRPALTLAASTPPFGDAVVAALGGAGRFPFYTADLPYLWGNRLRDGRIIFGAGLWFGPAEKLEHVGVDDEEPRAALDRLARRVRGLDPALGDVRFEHRWAGPIAIVPGRPPLLGRVPDASRVILAAGYTGHGVALAVRAGELVARAIAGEEELPSWGAFQGRLRDVG